MRIDVRIWNSEPYTGALAHKATGFSAKLLKRGDQCRAVLACAHLFWQAQDGGGGGESAEAAAEVRGCQRAWQQQHLRCIGGQACRDLRRVARMHKLASHRAAGCSAPRSFASVRPPTVLLYCCLRCAARFDFDACLLAGV